jgi:hypothetical protein
LSTYLLRCAEAVFQMGMVAAISRVLSGRYAGKARDRAGAGQPASNPPAIAPRRLNGSAPGFSLRG